MSEAYINRKRTHKLRTESLEGRDSVSTALDWLISELASDPFLPSKSLEADSLYSSIGNGTLDSSLFYAVEDPAPTGVLPPNEVHVATQSEERNQVSTNETRLLGEFEPLELTRQPFLSINLSSSSDNRSPELNRGATSGVATALYAEPLTPPQQTGPGAFSLPKEAKDENIPLGRTGASGNLMDDNAAPIAVNDSYSTIHDRTLNVEETNGLLANDSDPDQDPVQVLIVSQPANGSLQTQLVYSGGAFAYIPVSGFVGIDSFTYKLWDGLAESNIATVTINVTNNVPISVGEGPFTTFTEDDTLTGNVLANDSDPDGDPIQAVLLSGPGSGRLILKDDGAFVYTPPINFYDGGDYFTYAVTDGIANSSSITVYLNYGPQQLVDIDGKDPASSGEWMYEDDQGVYGIGVSVDSPPAYIIARTGDVNRWYPGYQIVQRSIVWGSGNTVAVNGSVTQIQLPLDTNNDVLEVTAIEQGWGETSLAYYVLLYNPITNDYIDGGNAIKVVEKKGVVDTIEFTSDHNEIRQNTRNARISGKRYNDIEYDRQTQYSAPITHTWNTKITLKLTYSLAGIAVGEQIKIVGASMENALQFDSGVIAAPGSGKFTLNLTATNVLPPDFKKIQTTISWWLQTIDPVTGNWKSHFMDNSGTHKVYIIAGSPRNHNFSEAMQVTDIRMDRVVDVTARAQSQARFVSQPNTPTWARFVYEVTRLHVFNVTYSVFGLDRPLAFMQVWDVYETWTIPFARNGMKGADCISGAEFSVYVLNMAGIFGEVTRKLYAASSANAPTVAIEYMNDNNRTEKFQINGRQGEYQHILAHLDGDNHPNAFEATIIYNDGTRTVYIPMGTQETSIGPLSPLHTEVVYGNPNDVLYVFNSLVWLPDRDRFPNAPVRHIHTYNPKPAYVNIDNV